MLFDVFNVLCLGFFYIGCKSFGKLDWEYVIYIYVRKKYFVDVILNMIIIFCFVWKVNNMFSWIFEFMKKMVLRILRLNK